MNITDPSRNLTADRGDAARRLDLTLRRHLTGVRSATRTRIQTWIENGQVTINGTAVRRVARRVAFGDLIAVTIPEGDSGEESAALRSMAAEDVGLSVLYEDEYLLALNKPAGVVVHPAYKNLTGTVMNALLWRARDWPAPQRPSIVGRLDKLTSGIVVVAKTAAAHAALQRTLAGGGAEKDYLAVVYGRVNRASGDIAWRLARDPNDRRKVVASSTVGAESLTSFRRLARARASGADVSLVRCRLMTGRMHQIRVHLASRGWPIVGDPIYGEPRWSAVRDPALAAVLRAFPRQALHAWRLSLIHPETGERLRLEAPVPRDLRTLLAHLALPTPG